MSAQISDGIESRQVAFSLLNEVFFKRKNLDEALAQSHAFEILEPRDRAFVRLLVATVLKRARQIDEVLNPFLHEPELKPAAMRTIFRLGFAQFAFLETQPHAVVNTTVMLAEAEGLGYQKSFVNAIMRRLTREGFPKLDAQDAGVVNTPEWLWKQWEKEYGIEKARIIVAANFDEAPLDITVKSNPEKWAELLEATVLPTGSLRKTGGGYIPDMQGFAEGEWWIQNAIAAVPAKLFGDLTGKTVIDLCAAPGGKTAQLMAQGADRVIAVDRSKDRVVRLKENMERLHYQGKVETVVADAAVWLPAEHADAILIDAPCTATGTIRHQPDILHLKSMADQEKLVALQRRLLVNSLNMVRAGGVIIYCTCSLQKAEGEAQVTWFLSQGFPVERSPIKAEELDGIAETLTKHGEIRALPSHWKANGGIDGFYVARFVRT
jgi:16S rRNA (cytosine967-C5)-methyltransferase